MARAAALFDWLRILSSSVLLGCTSGSVMVNLNNPLDGKEHASYSTMIITHYMQVLKYLKDSINIRN